MATGLQGVTGLYGAAPTEMQGRPASNWGGPADARHDVEGAGSAPGQRPYGGEVYTDQIAPGPEVHPAPLPGLPGNATPDVHSAPYPDGVTQDPLVAAAQMQVLHGLDLGGPAITVRASSPGEEPLTSGRYDSPNTSALAAGVPRQLRGGEQGLDVDQGDGAVNGFGFEFGRQFRRIFHTHVPLDRTGTVHGERPFYGHHSIVQPSFDVDSPYGPVAGDTQTGMGLGPTPVGYPTPYEQPANPTYLPSADYGGEAGFSSGWTAG